MPCGSACKASNCSPRVASRCPSPNRTAPTCARSARGERPLAEVQDAVSDAEARLAQLRDIPAIAEQPDRAWVDDWLHCSYLNFWARDH